MKAVVAAFNQEKALVGAFSVITNLRMELFGALVSSSGQCQAGAGIGRPGPRCPVRCPIPGQVPTVSAALIGPDAGSLAADWLAPVSSPHAITHLDPHFGLMALYPRLFLQRRTSFNVTRGSQALACAYEILRFRLHLRTTTSTCIQQHKLRM